MQKLISLSTVLWFSLGVLGQQSPARPAWPKTQGVFAASVSAAIPAFPQGVSGYKFDEGKDFWGNPFAMTGWIRVFEGNDWTGIPNFPNTMNGCSAGIFMIRWRSADPGIPIHSSVRLSNKVASRETKTSSFGYMSGTNCEQPMFKITDHLDRNKYPEVIHGHRPSYLVDIYYELKFWQAAP